MVFIGYDPSGKTLEEVLKDGNFSFYKGVAVFILKDEDDTIGDMTAEDISLRQILINRPELRTAVVASHNDFFGESVFRVRMAKAG